MELKRITTGKYEGRSPQNCPIDIRGQRFGKLVVLEIDEERSKSKLLYWKCKCDCGNFTTKLGNRLKSGVSISCGCDKNEHISKAKAIHGLSDTRLFNVWEKIKDRCCRKSHKSYAQYGGRGIDLCKEWQGTQGFVNFYNWSIENGYDETSEYMQCTIDRIDNNKGYSPDNCRWVDMKTQCNNRNNNRWVEYNGETHTISQWSEITHIEYSKLYWRLKHNWSVSEALGYEKHIKSRKGGRVNEISI